MAFHPVYNLICEPVHVSWMSAEDKSLLGQRQRTSLLMVASGPFCPSRGSSGALDGGLLLRHVTAEEHCTWASCFQGEWSQACSLSEGRRYLIPRDRVLQVQPRGTAWVKSSQGLGFLKKPSKDVQGTRGPCDGLKQDSCSGKTSRLGILEPDSVRSGEVCEPP